MTRALAGLFVLTLVMLAPTKTFALIEGGEGNETLGDPGWPKGAAAIFNQPGRVAWWVGPPFGGGQWHAECRGDGKALAAVLADFAKLDVKTKRVVLHDGSSHSFWLAPNGEPDKLEAAKIDWVFMVWQPENWQRLRKLPADLNPTDAGDTEPPAQIDVFTANIRWDDVAVPAAIEVIDQRLAAHGFALTDGVVIEGRVVDLATQQPIAATMRLERIEPQKAGGYLYTEVGKSRADAEGRWVLKNVPAAWVRVIVEADGFVPRIAGHERFDGQPQWKSHNIGLARAVTLAGCVTDGAGQPLAGVEVKLGNVEPETGGRYESPLGYTLKTDAEGRFQADNVPAGKATVRLHKRGYCRPGLGLPITTPKEDVELTMTRSGYVRVTVDFAGKKRPEQYLVTISPEEGDAIGTYGGTSTLDPNNEVTFENVPPGKYVVSGGPNPRTDKQVSETVTIDLKGGQAADVTLKAK